jgi:hypothetical protein
MEMDKIIIVIFILVVMALVLYLCLRKKSCPPSPPCQPCPSLSPDRISDILRSILPPNVASDKDLIECILTELSRKMSFTDFVNQNNKQRLESILGVKGNWSGCMNKFFMSFIKIPKDLNLPTPCISCIAGKLQNTYSPIDIINMNKDGSINNIFMNSYDSCKPPCV